MVPARLDFAATMHRLPEYRALVDGSRAILRERPVVRQIEVGFPLPPSTDPAFVYTILGGRLDPESVRSAVIQRDGTVTYR